MRLRQLPDHSGAPVMPGEHRVVGANRIEQASQIRAERENVVVLNGGRPRAALRRSAPLRPTTEPEPESASALAAGIRGLYQSPEARAAQSAKGLEWVKQFDAPLVARLFVDAVLGVPSEREQANGHR